MGKKRWGQKLVSTNIAVYQPQRFRFSRTEWGLVICIENLRCFWSYNEVPPHTGQNSHHLSLQIMVGEGVEKRDCSATAGGNVNWCSHHQKPAERFTQKTKNRLTIWSSNPTSGHITRQKGNLKRYMHSRVHSSTIQKSQDMEATEISISRCMDK